MCQERRNTGLCLFIDDNNCDLAVVLKSYLAPPLHKVDQETLPEITEADDEDHRGAFRRFHDIAEPACGHIPTGNVIEVEERKMSLIVLGQLKLQLAEGG